MASDDYLYSFYKEAIDFQKTHSEKEMGEYQVQKSQDGKYSLIKQGTLGTLFSALAPDKWKDVRALAEDTLLAIRDKTLDLKTEEGKKTAITIRNTLARFAPPVQDTTKSAEIVRNVLVSLTNRCLDENPKVEKLLSSIQQAIKDLKNSRAPASTLTDVTETLFSQFQDTELLHIQPLLKAHYLIPQRCQELIKELATTLIELEQKNDKALNSLQVQRVGRLLNALIHCCKEDVAFSDDYIGCTQMIRSLEKKVSGYN
ncbi:MAG: hypothetical protein JWO53_326 [Chlamydiia bacterium]|nr:hypothetical protein [Chlamydiia bacterium]